MKGNAKLSLINLLILTMSTSTSCHSEESTLVEEYFEEPFEVPDAPIDDLLLQSNFHDEEFEDPPNPKKPSDYRLPLDTFPLSYEIKIVADPNEERFSGETRIRIEASGGATSTIIVHVDGLNVSSTTVKDVASGEQIEVANVILSEDDANFYWINLEGSLEKGSQYDVEFEYDGRFSDDATGLYRTSYLNETGRRRYVAATNFHATHARKVFPCYDEPAMKAVFNLHIYAPTGYFTISNMDAIPSDMPPIPDFEVISFRPTPFMSTHLVAFVISDFDYKSNTVEGEILYPREYRTYARTSVKNMSMDFALDFGQRSLQYLQTYTDAFYRLPKIDNVALPGAGFNATANWGLVVYREDGILYEEGSSSANAKMLTSTSIAYENARFWFGNEVTPLWWDYAWLSEGFATFFTYFVTDRLYDGEWRLMEQFAVADIQHVMFQDSLQSTKAMSNYVASPADIKMKFDYITSLKSAAVIKMLFHAFTEPFFRLATSTYLKNVPNGVAEPQTLFDQMQSAIGNSGILPKDVTVGDVFESWSENVGFPNVVVNRTNNFTLFVYQRRFYSKPGVSSNQLWWIPLTWVTDLNPDFGDKTIQLWLRKSLNYTLIPIDESTEWYIFNKELCGYYRVMYDLKNWRTLVKVLQSENHTIIPILNKAQLIDDSGMYSRADKLTYNITFDILNYLYNETDWIPWIAASRSLSYLNPRMVGSNLFDSYKNFVAHIVKKVYYSVNFMASENDDYVTRQKRTLVTKIACDAGLSDCLKESEDVLRKYLQNDKEFPIYPDLKPVVYCSALRKGDLALWNGAFNRYLIANSEYEKNIILNGLGCVERDDIMESYLDMTISGASHLRPNDKVSVLRSALNSGPFGIGNALYFLLENFIEFKKAVGTTADIIRNLGEVLSSDKHITLFFNITTNYAEEFDTDERRAINTANSTIIDIRKWRTGQMRDIDRWLSDRPRTRVSVNANDTYFNDGFENLSEDIYEGSLEYNFSSNIRSLPLVVYSFIMIVIFIA